MQSNSNLTIEIIQNQSPKFKGTTVIRKISIIQMHNVKSTPQTEKSYKQDTPYRSQPRNKEGKNKCPNCEQYNPLVCYGCCYQLACEGCFSNEHFLNCNRQFNKHSIALSSVPSTEERSKGHRKHHRNTQKCRRCEEESQYLEFCKQCNVKLCYNCSNVLHAKGKFQQHNRTGSQSPQKLKRANTIQTQNCEVQIPKKEKKQVYESQQYGFRARDKIHKPSISDRASKQMTASTIAKKGRSIAKNSLENQENTPFRGRKNSIGTNDLNCSIKNIQQSISNEYMWLVCTRHNRKRSVLTESFDLVCSECYENLKNVVGKIKTIEVDSWLGSANERQAASGVVESISKYLALKGKELAVEFSRYKAELENELKTKKELLEERYTNNLLAIQKWENSYNSTISWLSSKCSTLLKSKLFSSDYKPDTKKQLQKLSKLQTLLLYQELQKGKKDFSQQLQQYNFKTNIISTNDFQQMLKSYSFLRKKIVGDEKVTKISQTTQLRQSRISNSSMVTDRKIRREDSMVKSNYYELSGKFLNRSRSKDVIKDDISKDISQKVLFPTNSSKSDKKNIPEKPSNFRNKNSYFFDTPTESKDPETPSLSLKDVKYINLETVINDRMQKTTGNSKRQSLQMSSNPLDQIKNTLYLGSMTEELPDKRQKIPQVPQLNMLSDVQMVQSVTMSQVMGSLNSLDSRATVTTSVNSSMQANKNKRKSDYMEMRDRLRKPSMMTKIGK